MLEKVIKEYRPYVQRLKDYDETLYNHSINVAIITEYLLDRLKAPDTAKKEIIAGALLHDIGKTYIDTKTLNKHGELTPNEYRVIKNHTWYGYCFLRDEGFNEIILDIVLNHHENEIGKGYPNRSTTMTFEAKIVSLADKYEAIHSKRSYKEGKTHEETMEILSYEFKNYCGIDLIKKYLADFKDKNLEENDG